MYIPMGKKGKLQKALFQKTGGGAYVNIKFKLSCKLIYSAYMVNREKKLLMQSPLL